MDAPATPLGDTPGRSRPHVPHKGVGLLATAVSVAALAYFVTGNATVTAALAFVLVATVPFAALLAKAVWDAVSALR